MVSEDRHQSGRMWPADFNTYRVAEETITCPFNKAHQITGMRYHLHIVRCAKQTVGRDVRICTFNAKHIIDVPKYAHHIEHCPDRDRLDRVITEKLAEIHESDKRIRSQPIDSAPDFQFSSGENWDDDVAAVPSYRRRGSYDPSAAISNRDVYRFPQEPMGKSSRRQFRSETVARLRQIQEGGSAPPSAASSTTAASASTGVGRRPTVPRMPYSSTLALTARPQLGRGQRVQEVTAPVGLSAGPSADQSVEKALHRMNLGCGRGRAKQTVVSPPGTAAPGTAGLSIW
ncbi:uncharacterized protein LOC122390514 isoform X2 [Amphibalanus amphitrite]|uniref:uncharacterized protein LOC122390514 isoform X2 n=2 Tax=Amphibalanus amphitrite TaxID=1232801 RepID=UPI001C904766|nr:uncharacterized protein LOC122390514 isoform X2 [Amphibalanus amphitrite]